MSPEHIVIVGASLAGLRTAEGLRRAGFVGRVTLVGDEQHLPYSRPPLSKQVLAGTWEPERAQLRSCADIGDLGVEFRLGGRARSLDTGRRVVAIGDGEELAYDAVVIATGASPRRLPGDDLAGVHVLRTIDDAVALRDAMATARRLVVVGGGFIGAEVAAVARARGVEVTVVEPLAAPMVRGLGVELGTVAGALHVENGVDLRCGVGVAGLRGDGRITGVELSDGDVVDCDLVVVGIGVVPNTGWLEGAGLVLDDGVVCDETLAAVGADDVWAAGDVARWTHPTYGETVRFEHWTVAADHGRAVADNIVAPPEARRPHAPLPYVWSDQYGTKIQIAGRGTDGDDLDVVAGAVDDRRFVAVRSRDGVVTGVVGFGSPRPFTLLSVRMGAGPVTVDEARQVVS